MTRYKIWLFLKLTRPVFLIGGVILFFLGAIIAWREGAEFRLLPLITGQLLVTCVQLMTHYANEYFDQESDRTNEHRTWFSGGSGVLVSGSLAPEAAWHAALVTGSFGLVFLVLAGIQTPVLFGFGLVSMLAAWFYSAPPLALSGSGWGELSASLVVAGLVPLFGYTTQAGTISGSTVLWVCLSLGLIHMAMLIAFQIPDYPSDLLAGKRTLAVRAGLRNAAHIHNLALFLGFAVILLLAQSRMASARLALLTLPLAVWQAVNIYRRLVPKSSRYLGLTMPALALFAITATLWLAGFLLF